MSKGQGWSFKVKCVICGKITGGRLPGTGRHRGDGSLWFPRRHKTPGFPDKDCPGNIIEGIIIENEQR